MNAAPRGCTGADSDHKLEPSLSSVNLEAAGGKDDLGLHSVDRMDRLLGIESGIMVGSLSLGLSFVDNVSKVLSVFSTRRT